MWIYLLLFYKRLHIEPGLTTRQRPWRISLFLIKATRCKFSSKYVTQFKTQTFSLATENVRDIIGQVCLKGILVYVPTRWELDAPGFHECSIYNQNEPSLTDSRSWRPRLSTEFDLFSDHPLGVTKLVAAYKAHCGSPVSLAWGGTHPLLF